MTPNIAQPDMVPLGFVGLAQIGTPMSRRLLDWPEGLIACDESYRIALPLHKHGASVFKTPAQVAAKAPIVSVVGRDDAHVTELVAGPDGILEGARPGAIVAIHSPLEVGTPEKLAALAQRKGVTVVDAPVAGGMLGAIDGRLAMMIGGPVDAVDRLREPFSRMATLIAHMGDVGSATRARLARNLITFAAFAAVGDAMRLAEANGVDLDQLGEVVRHSDAVTGGPGAIMLRNTTEPLAAGRARAVFARARKLGEADLVAALRLAQDSDLDLPMAKEAYRVLGEALGVPDH